MIDEIVPSSAAAAEAREDAGGASPFVEEELIVANAVESRRRSFTTARGCARRALSDLGVGPTAIVRGERGEPCWPEGFVGSITHCDGYRAAVVARASDLLSVGIDAEPNAGLRDGVLEAISSPEERHALARLARAEARVGWGRLLFSAKESVYKAWYPLTKRWLGFKDAVVTFDAARGRFRARVLVEGPSLPDRCLTGFEGRWLVRDGLLLTAVACPALPAPAAPPAPPLSPAPAQPPAPVGAPAPGSGAARSAGRA
ncbi:MAG TPA: 4'-phosphopantetheinyl transferase superfamily protein [Solirubrobacteraceae bacterium]|nr:4'-phosphopantetheinyl transferase superfamily protein [Solirubrobacteraceae bacterium]